MKKIALLITAALVFSATSLYAQTAQTRLDNGKRLFDQGNYDGAIQELDNAIKRDPKMAEAYMYRARSYNGKGNSDQAISDATKAIQLNPKMAMAYFARGCAYRDKKDYDRAIADNTEAIKLDPQLLSAYFNRGNAYVNKEDYDRAIVDYTEAIRLDPNLARAYNNRGIAYKNKNDYDRAIADFEAALKLDPNDSTARNNLAEARKKAEEEQTKNAEQTRLANLYRQAGNNLGNLKNATKIYINTSLYLTATYNFGDGNYIFEQKTTSRNAFDQMALNVQKTGTFRVNGNTVIFISSEGEYSSGTIIGTTLQIDGNIYR